MAKGCKGNMKNRYRRLRRKYRKMRLNPKSLNTNLILIKYYDKKTIPKGRIFLLSDL